MMEHIKSVVLTLLIINSILLTWMIWTYQPEYRVLEESDYIRSERIGEERSLQEVIYPEKIVIHENDQSFWLHPTNDAYESILEQFENVQLEYFYSGSDVYGTSLNGINGLEIIFPDRLQGDWIKSLFNMDAEIEFPMESADRILVFNNDQSTQTEVSIRFLSSHNNEFYQINTGISVNQLQAWFSEYGERTEVKSYPFRPSTRSLYSKRHYVPVESAGLKRYTFFINSVDDAKETFRDYLFNDPELVRHYFSGNQEVFTDGNRMINILENGNVLKYVHPALAAQPESSERTIVEASVDFINGHAGWTDAYKLDEWFETPFNDRVKYRMHVDGLPVMGVNVNRGEFFRMELSREGNRISEYIRPLFHLEAEVYGLERISLPDFQLVMNLIDESENFQRELVEDAKIGYYMRKQTSLIIFEPAWFVKERGNWRRVDIRDEQLRAAQEREVE